MDWIKELLVATEDLESPKSYYYWAALATISAVVGKRVYLNRGGVYNLYPNIYVFLISKKSGLRKGVPVNMAKKLTHDVGTVRVIDGQNSVQGMIKELGKIYTTPKGHVIKEAEGFLITGEFASFMLQDGTNFSLTTLTDLYDTQYHEQGFKKRLSTQDEISLKNPCISGLFASNETHFFDVIPKNAISGGFLARTFCIYEEKRNAFNSLTKAQTKKIDYNKIVRYLEELSKVTGEFRLAPKAVETYDKWYYDFVGQESDDDTGTDERIGDNILKAAMLISLARDSDLVIENQDIVEAIEKSMEAFAGMRRLLFSGTGDPKSVKATAYKSTMSMLLGAPGFEVSRRKVLLKAAGSFGPYDLDEVIENFLQSKVLVIEKRGGETYYRLKEWVIERHKKLNKDGEERVN